MGSPHIDPATAENILGTPGTTRYVAERFGVSPVTVSRLRRTKTAVDLAKPHVGRPRLDAPSSATRQQRQRRARVASERDMSGALGEAATPTNSGQTPINRSREIVAEDTNGAQRIPDPQNIQPASKPRFRGILGTHCVSCGEPLKAHDRRPSGWPAGYPGPCSGAS